MNKRPQERPQTLGLGETRHLHHENAVDLGAADLELLCPHIIMATILITALILLL